MQLVQHGWSERRGREPPGERVRRARAWDVLALARPTGKRYPRFGIPLAEGYPYVEAEVRYACREHAVTIEDILSRRTRLAFLNAEAARDAVERVAEIMTEELGWTAEERARQLAHAYDYVKCFGGPIADKTEAELRTATDADLREAFARVDADGSGYVSVDELRRAAEFLGFPVDASDAEFGKMDTNGDGKALLRGFAAWWNEAPARGAPPAPVPPRPGREGNQHACALKTRTPSGHARPGRSYR